MENRDRQVIVKILDEIRIITELVDGIEYDTFAKDERTKRAVCMTLINIGELVKALSDSFKESNP
ncbi:MAG TPA: antitoxin, partial [Clostridiales bacterium]|nr:antitoxin [Clostridiales bacterium]